MDEQSDGMDEVDVVVVGGGIVGASIAAELAADRSVLVLEAEPQPDVHATGRSAGVWRLIYGDAEVSALVSASRPLLENPPSSFSESSFLRPRPILFVALPGEVGASRSIFERGRALEPAIEQIDVEQAVKMSPGIKPNLVDAFVDPTGADIDVSRLHQSYLAKLRSNGGQLDLNRSVTRMVRENRGWTIETTRGSVRAGAVVNAAGAWGDEVATRAGVLPARLSPRRRTVIGFDPGELRNDDGPMVVSVTNRFYYKPDGGTVLASPFDEVRDSPRFVKPEEQDVAATIDRMAEATVFPAMTEARSIRSSWAGLRTFCPDRRPTLGWDVNKPGFFWAVGLGGFGIETAPAVSTLCAELFAQPSLPSPLAFAPGRRWR